jgi:hypothetical protein
MDPKIVTLLANYMTKTGSISADTRSLVDRMYRYIEKQDHAKTASIATVKDHGSAIAQKMADVRLSSGQPLIAGAEMIKEAQVMLSDHDEALTLFDMVLDSFVQDRQKQASLDPGRPTAKTTDRELSAIEGLMADCGITV